MALNPQPYLSDSTDEFLIDALPAISAGITPEEILEIAIADSEPDDGDNMERILGFLQIWLAQPTLLTGWLIPMLSSLAEDETDQEQREQIVDQMTGAMMLSKSSPMGPLANDIGLQLAYAAFAETGTDGFVNNYGTWFQDQRLEAIAQLIRSFGGDPSTPPVVSDPTFMTPMT